MYRGIEGILISSENAEKLAEFYREKVGLKMKDEMEMGDKGEKAYEFEMEEGPSLVVMDHSEIKGKNKDGARIMFNLDVKGKIEDAVKKLDDSGVKKIQDVYHIEGYGLIATFEDIDGNYFQLVQVREA